MIASYVLQVLDHVGIYMLIAGSYTPFLLIGLHHYTSATVLLIAEWIAAACGTMFVSKFACPISLTCISWCGFRQSFHLKH